MERITADEIRALTGGAIRGSGERVLTGVAPLEKAQSEALSFVASARYLPYLQATRAGAVLVKPEWAEMVPEKTTAIVVDDPYLALEAVLSRLHPPKAPPAGIHPTAVVAADARVAPDAGVGPYAVVGAGCEIGPGSYVGAHAVLGDGCRIGAGVTIHPHATLYDGVRVDDRSIIHSGARIGKDGFGFVWKDGGHRKIPQVGGCHIEADVEVGANVTIDRGSISETVIGAGTKIDNLAQIGHNVQIGKHSLIVSQVGISGSSIIGDGVVLAGQAGVAGHVKIGAGARIGGQSAVMSDIPAGQAYSGYPARPHQEALRAQAMIFKLPDLFRRLKRIEEVLFPRTPK